MANKHRESIVDELKPGDRIDVYGLKHPVTVLATDGPDGFKTKVVTEEERELYVADSDVLHVLDLETADLHQGIIYMIDPSRSSTINMDVDLDQDPGLYVWTGDVAVRISRLTDGKTLRSWSKRGHILSASKFIRFDPKPVDVLTVRAGKPGDGWSEYSWKLLK